MPELIQIVIEGEDEDGSWSETVWATPLGENLYRAEETPIFSEVVEFGDVVEALPGPDRALRLVRVVERSDWRTERWMVPRATVEDEHFERRLEEFEALGGRWDRAMGGILSPYIPPGVEFDPSSLFTRESS